MRIVYESQLPSMRFEVLSVVEGKSCQNKSYQPPASRVAAIDQLKAAAAQLQADSITRIGCSGCEDTSLRTNCWTPISGSASRHQENE